MKSLVRRDTGVSYDGAVLENPTKEQAARLRKRKKKAFGPMNDPRRAMKDGRTKLAYKAEHAVDLASGALLAVTVQPVLNAKQEAQESHPAGIEEVVAVHLKWVVAGNSARAADIGNFPVLSFLGGFTHFCCDEFAQEPVCFG